MMNRDVLDKINDEANFSAYARNKVKAMGNEIADITGKVEFASGLVGEGLLSEELYTKFVLRQRKEIKDIVSQIYSYLHLGEVKGHYDNAFIKEDKPE